MERVRKGDGVIFLSGLKKVNHDIFDMLGLIKDIPTFKTEKEALEQIVANNW
jgi:hypothetical protein